MSDARLPLATRLWFAWVCFFRVLFDPGFASRAFAARALPSGAAEPTAPERRAPEERAPRAVAREPAKPVAPDGAALAHAREEGSLQLLALLQREGRLVDFLQQDVASFDDAEIGATARVIHEGCRKVLRAHVELRAIRAEEEGARVTLAAGFAASEIKLTGNVGGKAPYTGALRHRGWRADRVTLPTPVDGYDAAVVCPAEVEL